MSHIESVSSNITVVQRVTPALRVATSELLTVDSVAGQRIENVRYFLACLSALFPA